MEPTKAAKGTQRPERRRTKQYEQYLITSATDAVVDRLNADHEVNVVRTIQPKDQPAEGIQHQDPVAVVAQMPPEHAMRLAASPDLVVETDQPLRYGLATTVVADPGLVLYSEPAEITVRVQDVAGEPVQDAEVRLVAATSSGPARTDRSGKAVLTIAAQEITSVAGLLVQPRDGYWNAWRPWPQLSTADSNLITLTRIDTDQAASWARRLMGFDRLPPNYRGDGVRVCIIDSGAAVPSQVSGGHDFIARDDKSWQDDVTGYGTAIASTISGLAPEAELHILKVFPGGRISDLVAAIDHSIAVQADVIAVDLGTVAASWLVARKLAQAREYGIGCIVAAGNNTGPVSFPANLPGVLTVSAIGKLGTFPGDSYHATQFTGESSPDGFFPARFSAYGPQVDLCAPGVGVVCALPNESIGAVDGTAVAVGHIAGLAALMLAHHPGFAGVKEHSPLRVDRLFAALRESCVPLPYCDRLKVGWGQPDAPTALGLVRIPMMMPFNVPALAR